MKLKVLHITFDYAEDNLGLSTVVISDLIKETSKIADVKIISITRITNPFKEDIRFKKSATLLRYKAFGLPYGILLATNMRRISKKLHYFVNKNESDFLDCNIIHSHKLTFEGCIGYLLSKQLNKKLFISLRQTDTYVLKFRKDLLGLSKSTLSYASKIFYIAPYMRDSIANLFGNEFYENELRHKMTYLPNSIKMNNFIFRQDGDNKNLLCICWLNKKAIKRKNIYRLFQAIKLLENKDMHLDLIGKGDYVEQVKKWAKDLNIEDQVNFLGFIKNQDISKYLNSSKAFVLPSLSETFGVAYAEALVSGTPILYSKGTGFDGIFDDVGVSVNPHSVGSIAGGISELMDKSDHYRMNIKRLHDSGAFKIFSRKYISEVYKKCIEEEHNTNI